MTLHKPCMLAALWCATVLAAVAGAGEAPPPLPEQAGYPLFAGFAYPDDIAAGVQTNIILQIMIYQGWHLI